MFNFLLFGFFKVRLGKDMVTVTSGEQMDLAVPMKKPRLAMAGSHCPQHSALLQLRLSRPDIRRDFNLFKLHNITIYLTRSLLMDINGANLLLLQIIRQQTVQMLLYICVSTFVVQISGSFPAGSENIEQIFKEH